MEEVHVVGSMATGLRGASPPVGLWGIAPVEGLGTKKNVKLIYNF